MANRGGLKIRSRRGSQVRLLLLAYGFNGATFDIEKGTAGEIIRRWGNPNLSSEKLYGFDDDLIPVDYQFFHHICGEVIISGSLCHPQSKEIIIPRG